ncbi:MAG: FAD-dependent oxidoreductase [Nitrospira sp.]|nr:FAD-dependent oxidoreductase [Nitrospira sp.]
MRNTWSDLDYDLICIGSGPAVQRAAVQTAKLGKRAAVIERGRFVGGVCANTGTIPSKAFREAVLTVMTRAELNDGLGQPWLNATRSSHWTHSTSLGKNRRTMVGLRATI